MTHIMIDLETLGIHPVSAPIIQVAAIPFELDGDGPALPAHVGAMQPFNAFVDVASNLREPFNRRIEPDTVAWWAETDPQMLVAIMRDEEAIPLHMVLGQLSVWDIFLDAANVEGVWANGATFDVTMLEVAYAQAEMTAPWHFRTIRDVRTIAMIAAGDDACWQGGTITERERTGKKHDALVDCLRQIRLVQQTYQRRIKPTGMALVDVMAE